MPALCETVGGLWIWGFIGLVCPKGMPAAVIHTLNAALNEGLQQPDLIARMAGFGMQPTPTTPQEFAQYVNDQLRHWSALIKQAGIKPE